MNGEVKKSFLRSILTIVGLPIIGAVLTLAVQQLFFNQNKRTEERIKFKAEIIKKEYELFNQLDRFLELGSTKMNMHYKIIYVDKNNKVISEEPVEKIVLLPIVDLDSNRMREFNNLFKTINDNRFQIPNEIFSSANELNKFLIKNNIPVDSRYKDVQSSPWGKEDNFNEWSRLFKDLHAKISAFENLE